jgi:hypothetical protein
MAASDRTCHAAVRLLLTRLISVLWLIIAVIVPTRFADVLKFVLLSTLGDAYYIGLNGIELFDHEGRAVPIDPDESRRFFLSLDYGVVSANDSPVLLVARCLRGTIVDHSTPRHGR